MAGYGTSEYGTSSYGSGAVSPGGAVFGPWIFVSGSLNNTCELDTEDPDIEPLESTACALVTINDPASTAELYQEIIVPIGINYLELALAYKDGAGDGVSDQFEVYIQKKPDGTFWDQATLSWTVVDTAVALPYSVTRITDVAKIASGIYMKISGEVRISLRKLKTTGPNFNIRLYHMQLRETRTLALSSSIAFSDPAVVIG